MIDQISGARYVAVSWLKQATTDIIIVVEVIHRSRNRGGQGGPGPPNI